MIGWKPEKEKILKGIKMSPAKKLEGMRLMNELADKALTLRQKAARQDSRGNG